MEKMQYMMGWGSDLELGVSLEKKKIALPLAERV